MTKKKVSNLSTTIDSDVKEAVALYCKKRGLKLRYVVEQALIERLEDEFDLEAYHERKNEELFSLEDVLSERS